VGLKIVRKPREERAVEKREARGGLRAFFGVIP
jgi:hypothetical protein